LPPWGKKKGGKKYNKKSKNEISQNIKYIKLYNILSV